MVRAVDTLTLDHDTIREAFEFIAENLRKEDLDEVRATIGDRDPFWGIFESYEASTATWLILDDTGLPIGVFGVSSHMVPKVGVAWMLGTPGILKNAHSVARQTRQYVGEMQDLYPILWANVDGRNELSMRWLEWSGFKLMDADANFGPENRLFLQYTRTA